MCVKKRFIEAVVTAAQRKQVEMPWARGLCRKPFVKNRQIQTRPDKRTA